MSGRRAAAVDTVVRFGFGARLAALGPLVQSDLVGLDRLTAALAPPLVSRSGRLGRRVARRNLSTSP